MSYSAFAIPTRTAFDLRAAGLGPAARTIGLGLSWLGGGILFAVTVYVMLALPGVMME